MKVMQLDAYAIPITIKKGDTVITDDNCTEMIIKLGDVQKSLSDEEIYYDDTLAKWIFPLTQAQSKTMYSVALLQAEFTIGTSIYNTPVVSIDVGNSIIEVEDE